MSELVLVAEDDSDLRRVLVRVLLAHGYDVAAAADGAEAWEQLVNLKPALLVSDVRMPKRSGTELLVRLRSEGSTLPVVLITGFAPGVEAVGRKHGATVLWKPFTAAELIGALNRATGAEPFSPPEPLKSTG